MRHHGSRIHGWRGVAAWVAVVSAIVLLSACSVERHQPRSRDLGADLASRFQAELERIRQEGPDSEAAFPGATAAYLLPDGRNVGVSTGYSDLERGIPMPVDARMPAGSIGKTFVAAVAMALDQEGALSLDDPISNWLGEEEWFDRLPNGEEITVRMLLNHSSGLRNHVFESSEFQEAIGEMVASGDADRYLAPRELVELILDTEPVFPPGRGFHYTDTGYILVGMILERAGGAPYYEQLERRFLEPLRLDDTVPQIRRGVPGLAQGYAVRSAEIFGLPRKLVEEGKLVFHPLVEWTGGGLYSNPRDLVRWAGALYEGEAIQGDYLEDLLHSVVEGGSDPPERRYGLGVEIEETPFGPAYGHSGFFPGYLSKVRYFPDHDFAVATQLNTDAEQPEAQMMPLARIVMEALERPEG